MIDQHIGHAAFRLGFYLAFVSGILYFLTEPSSAERAISLLTLIISVSFLVVVVILVRLGGRHERSRKE